MWASTKLKNEPLIYRNCIFYLKNVGICARDLNARAPFPPPGRSGLWTLSYSTDSRRWLLKISK